MAENQALAIYNNTFTAEEIDNLTLPEIQSIKLVINNYVMQGYLAPQTDSAQLFYQRENILLREINIKEMEKAPYRVEKKHRKGRNIAKLIVGYISLFSAVFILANVLNSNNILKQSQKLQNTTTITNIQLIAAISFMASSFFMVVSNWSKKSNIGNILVIATSLISIILFGIIIKLYPVVFYLLTILCLNIIFIIIISKKAKK